MLNRHNHIRINHERIRAQAARLDEQTRSESSKNRALNAGSDDGRVIAL